MYYHMLMKKLILSSILIILTSLTANSAKYAGEAFSLGVGGRSLALGGATIAGPFDASAGYWNPAGLVTLGNRSAIAMHAETFGSLLNHDFLGYVDARPKENAKIKAFGFYLYYLGGGGIKITQLNQFDRPEVIREESHGDYLLTGSVAGNLTDKLDFGLTAKIIYRDIGTETGKGLTLDAGLLYRYSPAIQVGLMVTDITTGFIRYSGKTFDTGANSESIYPTVKPGLMLTHLLNDFTGRFLMSGDIKFENIKYAAQYWSGPLSLDTHFGWELAYKEILFGRTGFDIGRFTAGGGIHVNKLSLDFAYLNHDDLDETYRISAGFIF
ncbi:MAG: hypothetical protein DWP97_09290 [Calditrichaeota bacterium]|nr:MAG: hypothetical protein DWP97_09290 [Calditrichota bacterium]